MAPPMLRRGHDFLTFHIGNTVPADATDYFYINFEV